MYGSSQGSSKEPPGAARSGQKQPGAARSSQDHLWFDGSAVPITRSQNDQGSKGHFLYQGTAPIFVTCKLPDLEWLESLAAVDEKTGRPYDADASMLLRRLKIYRFAKRVAKPACKFPFCASCFSKLLLQQAGMAGV